MLFVENALNYVILNNKMLTLKKPLKTSSHMCVYVRVRQISGKTNNFDSFSLNLLKNRFRVGNSEN